MIVKLSGGNYQLIGGRFFFLYLSILLEIFYHSISEKKSLFNFLQGIFKTVNAFI